MTRGPVRRLLAGALLAGVLGTLASTSAVGPAAAASDSGNGSGSGSGATIAHLQPADHGVDVLVSLPAGAHPDLSHVTVSVDGTPLSATAQQATASDAVRRTAILLIDTSDSMNTHGRLAAAKQAAKQYVATLPANVDLGIVTFASGVSTALAPTRDHAKAAAIIDGLTTTRNTLLYDGVEAAVAAAGTEGQRSVLLVTDGEDVGSTATLAQAAGAVRNAGVLLDAVGVHETARALADLQTLADAGQGEVLAAETTALRQRFVSEASVLAHQVLVTAQFPAGFDQTAGQVSVTLSTDAGPLTASAVDTDLQAPPGSSGSSSAERVPVGGSGPRALPGWVVYAGALLVGIGLLSLILALLPKRTDRLSPEERVAAYAAAVTRAPAHRAQPPEESFATAKNAAADLLHRHATLEARITARLDAAGSDLKPAEWLLLHVGIAFVAGLLGVLVGHGIWLGLLFLAVGIVGPWLYLGYRRGKRRKAFDAALPDTLQLMSGSMSAGLSLAQAVDTVVREGADPIAAEFRRVMVEARLGVPLEDALEGIAERFDSDDFRWVVMSIRIQRQVGGNLGELLDTVGGTMRERQYLRRQVLTLAAEGKMSAWVLGVLPPLFFLYLLVANPTYVAPLIHQAKGFVLLAGGGLWLGLGVFWMSRLVKVEV